MNIYCTGSRGNLGRELVNLGCLPFEADVLDFDAVRQEMLDKAPDVLIHLAGLNVDMSGTDYNKAIHVAVRGTANVIDKDLYPKVRTIYISSSHVFDGKRGNYREGDKPNPINDYGTIKMAAEGVTRVSGGKIIRLSTCFSKDHKDIQSWQNTIGVGDGMALPTFIRRNYAHINHIAQGIMSFANRYDFMPPLMNLAGTDDLSMYEFALAVAAHYGWNKRLIEPRKKEVIISGQAKRPYRATLNTNLAKKNGIPLFSALDGIALL